MTKGLYIATIVCFFLIITGSSLAFSIENAIQGWLDFASQADGFQVSLPSPPTKKEQNFGGARFAYYMGEWPPTGFYEIAVSQTTDLDSLPTNDLGREQLIHKALKLTNQKYPESPQKHVLIKKTEGFYGFPAYIVTSEGDESSQWHSESLWVFTADTIYMVGYVDKPNAYNTEKFQGLISGFKITP